MRAIVAIIGWQRPITRPPNSSEIIKMHANDHYAAILRACARVQGCPARPHQTICEPGQARTVPCPFQAAPCQESEILGDQFFPFFPGEGRKTVSSIFFWATTHVASEGRQLTGAGAQKT